MNDALEMIHKMQAYIAEHIEDDISWQDLARISAYSPWHAHRLFTQWTAITPGDYIRRLRLSKSAIELRDHHVSIIEVALRYGFTTPEGYQRAFAKEFGLNPQDYQANPIPLSLFIPYPIIAQEGEENMSQHEKTTPIFVTIVQRPARKVIVKRGIKADNYWDYSNEVGCDVWGILTSIKSLVREPVGMWLPPSLIPTHTSSYIQGVEVGLTEVVQLPPGFEQIILPEATYLMFQSAPFEDENYESVIGAVWDAMSVYNPSALGYQWDDRHPRIQLEPRGERGYIELRAIIRR